MPKLWIKGRQDEEKSSESPLLDEVKTLYSFAPLSSSYMTQKCYFHGEICTFQTRKSIGQNDHAHHSVNFMTMQVYMLSWKVFPAHCTFNQPSLHLELNFHLQHTNWLMQKDTQFSEENTELRAGTRPETKPGYCVE